MFRLKPRDLLIFEALQRHGPLSSLYLFALTKDAGRASIWFRVRLKVLTDNGYLARPLEINHPAIKNDFLVYVLTDKSLDVLKKAGKAYRYARPVGGGYDHMMMAAAATASMELAVRHAGFRYIDQEEILSEAPQETREAFNPLRIPSSITRTRKGKTQTSNRPTEPDQLFAIEYEPGSRRYFALEADRGTESERRSDLDDNSIERKLLCYQDILKRGTFKKHFGVAKMFPAFITTAPGRMTNMVALADEIVPEYSDLFIFKWLPGFELYQHTPPLFPQVFEEAWMRIRKPLDISKV